MKIFKHISQLLAFVPFMLVSCMGTAPFLTETPISLAPSVTPTHLPTSTMLPQPSPTPTPTLGLISSIYALQPGDYIMYYTSAHKIAAISPTDPEPIFLTGDDDKVALNISYDGRILVFSYYREKSIFVINLDNQEIKEFRSRDECNSIPVVSPDAQWLACAGDNIFVLSLSEGNWKQLTNPNWPNTEEMYTYWHYPFWSPDGTLLVSQLEESGQLEYPGAGLYLTTTSCLENIETCPANTQGPLAKTTVGIGGMAWSPDSKHILTTNIFDLYLVDIENRTTSLFLSDIGAFSMAWSPYWNMIVIESREDGSLTLINPETKEISSLGIDGYVLGWLHIP